MLTALLYYTCFVDWQTDQSSHWRLLLHSHYRSFIARASALTTIKVSYTVCFPYQQVIACATARCSLRFDLDNLVVLAHIALVVDERKLKADAGIEIVEEVAPAFKDGVLILVLCQLVVNVVESDGFGIQMFLHPADTIAPHFQIRNGTLHGQPLFLFVPFGFTKELLEEAAELRFLLRFTFYQECLLSSGSVLRFPVPCHTGFQPHSGVPMGV